MVGVTLLTTTGFFKAEGTGNEPPGFCNLLPSADLEPKQLEGNELGPSGCTWLVPVVPGCGGRAPGQNRDKVCAWCERVFHLMIPYLAIALPAVGIVPGDDGKHRGPHSKPETERERHALLERTAREIDQLATEFHAKLSRERADSIGAIYCRYSTRHQDSVADQVRSILEEAVRLGIFVPREYIFFE